MLWSDEPIDVVAQPRRPGLTIPDSARTTSLALPALPVISLEDADATPAGAKAPVRRVVARRRRWAAPPAGGVALAGQRGLRGRAGGGPGACGDAGRRGPARRRARRHVPARRGREKRLPGVVRPHRAARRAGDRAVHAPAGDRAPRWPRARPSCSSAPSTGAWPACASSGSCAGRAGERELARAREETETLRRSLDEERRERTWRDHFDPLTGLPAGERLERTIANALATATPTSQVAVALSRHRAAGADQQPARPRPRELRSPAGRAAADHRAPLRGGAAARRRPVAVHGRPHRRRRLRGDAHRAPAAGKRRGPPCASCSTALSGRYLAGGEEVFLSASAGVALAPADGSRAWTRCSRRRSWRPRKRSRPAAAHPAATSSPRST